MATEVDTIFSQGLSRIGKTVDDTGYAFTALDVSEKGVTSLDAIKPFIHLQYAKMDKNEISDVSPLADIMYLLALDLNENAIEEPPKFSNPHLQIANMASNQLTTLEGIEGTALTKIDVSSNKLVTLLGLGGLSALKTAVVASNEITEIGTVGATVEALENLDLSKNQLESLAGVENFPVLKSINLSGNQISEMSEVGLLQPLEGLQELDLTENPVSETEDYRLAILALLPKLKKLDGVEVTLLERRDARQRKERLEKEAAEAEEE